MWNARASYPANAREYDAIDDAKLFFDLRRMQGNVDSERGTL